MNDFFARSGYFVNDAIGVHPAVGSRSVKVTCRIDCDVATRAETVVTTRKVVQHVLSRRRQLENDTTTVAANSARAARDGRSVEVSASIEGDAAVRVFPIRKTTEGMEHAFFPRRTRSRREFEN